MPYNFNTPLYEIQFADNDDEIHVYSFDGTESISHIYQYQLKLVSSNPSVDSSTILNRKATFVINRGDDEPLKINGIVSSFHQRGSMRDYYIYDIVLVPRMWRLSLNHRSTVYQHMNIEDIVTQLLRNAGFAGEDFEFQLEENYPVHEYVVQYRETDFQFINRRLEHYGIFYFFDQRDDKDVIVFADSNEAFESIESDGPVRYKPDEDPLGEFETIREIYSDERVVTGLVRLKDYNYEHPEKQLIAESHLDSDAPGTFYEYGDNFKDDQEGEFLARIRNEEFICGSKIISGTGNCRLLRAGNTFELEGHYRDEWNNEYILTNVHVKGNQRGLFGLMQSSSGYEPTFESSFSSIPADVTFRPKRKTKVPRLYGIMTAKIESGAGDDYAYIDDYGRYKLKLPFDLNDNSEGDASKPVRMMQTYSGPDYGIHFPNHKDTEAIWACVDGDPDRPIILGTVPNTANTSPAKSDNKAQSVIRTAGENEIIMDDTEGKQKFSIIAPHDMSTNVKHDKEDHVDGNWNLRIGGDESITVGGNKKELVQGDSEEKTIGSKKEIVDFDEVKVVAGATSETFMGMKHSTHVGGKFEMNAAASATINADAKFETIAAAKTEIAASATLKINKSKEKNLIKSSKEENVISYKLDSKTGVNINGVTLVLDNKSGKLSIKPGGVVMLESKGNVIVKAAGVIKLDGKVMATKDMIVTGKIMKPGGIVVA